MIAPKPIIGKVFGRLTVVAIAEKRGKNYYYACKCSCGTEKSILGRSLRTGYTRSCGCLNVDTKRARRLGRGESVLNTIYSQYRHSARKREHEFSLSKDEFRNYLAKDCYYCGLAPYNKRFGYYHDTDEAKDWASITYNGIDRLDNNKGYVPENCVPCCKLCNYIKFRLSFVDFVKQIARIYWNLFKKGLMIDAISNIAQLNSSDEGTSDVA